MAAYRELFREHEELVHVTIEVQKCENAKFLGRSLDTYSQSPPRVEKLTRFPGAEGNVAGLECHTDAVADFKCGRIRRRLNYERVLFSGRIAEPDYWRIKCGWPVIGSDYRSRWWVGSHDELARQGKRLSPSGAQCVDPGHLMESLSYTARCFMLLWRRLAGADAGVLILVAE